MVVRPVALEAVVVEGVGVAAETRDGKPLTSAREAAPVLGVA